MENQFKKKIVKSIRELGRTHSVWNVFSDFTELSAISIANIVDKRPNVWETREKRYRDIMENYASDDRQLFPVMFADLVEALELELNIGGGLADVLGTIFHDLELHNKYKGQFFTPQHVCDLIGRIVFDERLESLKEDGFISLHEPCAGSGALILGVAKAMKEKGLNYCTELVVNAADIDLKCVHMCYVQLSLYGIPAVIVHSNSLTLEEWSRWYTPVYIMNNWEARFKTRKERR